MADLSTRRRLIPAIAGAILLALGATVVIVLRHLGGPADFVPRPAEHESDIVKSEDAYDKVNPQIKGGFVKALKGRDWKALEASLAPGFRARWPRPGDGKDIPDGTMVLRDYRDAAWKETDAAGFVAVMKEHIDGWKAVERTTWRPFEFLMDVSGKSAFASVHFQVAGSRQDETRADLTGIVRAQVVPVGGKDWKLSRLEFVEGCRAEGKTRPWRDVTAECGLMFQETEAVRTLRAEIINDRGAVTLGGLAVCDWNGDGFYDVLATRAGTEAALFINDGRGGFVRGRPPFRSGREAGYAVLRVDLDNDGVDELVTGQVLEYDAQKAYLAVYVQDGKGGWEARPRALAAKVTPGTRSIVVQGIEAADLDGNGFLDLFVCNYSNAESLGGAFNRIAAYDGMDNWLFMNYGKLDLREESAARGVEGTQYSYVAKAFDFDGDGDLDVFEGNDFGPNHLWVNDGGAKFHDAKDHIFDADSNYTMGVSIADWDNTGDWSMNISNMYSHAGNRIVPLAKDLSPDMLRLGKLLAQGNQFYERKGGAWSETAVDRGVNWADWAWGCVFFDADNDGDRDLFVANGYTTNTDPTAPDY